MANTLGIRIVRPVTLRKFQQPELDLSKELDTNELLSSGRVRPLYEGAVTDYRRSETWNAHSYPQSQPSTVDRTTQTHSPCTDDTDRTDISIRSTVADDRADMPVSSTLTFYSMHQNNQNFSNFDRDGQKSMDCPALGGTLANTSAFNGIKQTGYDIYGGELEYRSVASVPGGESGGRGGGGGVGSGPVVKQTGSLVDEFGPKEAPLRFGSSKDTFSKMTRAVAQKPEGIGESLAWLKRELMDLHNTDKELERTLFTLQSKIRDLKSKINQDEADDDDDDSEKTDYQSSWSSNGQRNDSFSTPTSQKINIIKEENEEEQHEMEIKPVKRFHEEVTVTRTAVKEVNAVNTAKATNAVNTANAVKAVNTANAVKAVNTANAVKAVNSANTVNSVNVTPVNGNAVHANMVNGSAVNHNANGYSRNTNNSLDQTVRPAVSLRKSVTSDGLKNYSNLEKPNLPPPPPPPVSASPTPSLKSTSSSEVVHRFAMKEESKRDSMSSSSFVSSSSSFTSSLEELRLQDVPRDLRSSGRSFDRMTFDEEEEESEEVVVQDVQEGGEEISIKDNAISFDDNGNEGTSSEDTTEASRLMDSIWAEVAMFS